MNKKLFNNFRPVRGNRREPFHPIGLIASAISSRTLNMQGYLFGDIALFLRALCPFGRSSLNAGLYGDVFFSACLVSCLL